MVPAKISFGIIVLNGEPFIRHNLRSLYPYAHEIIVAEGASPKAAHAATADGHSTDGTLEVLRRFRQEEDPAHKLTIVTAEDDGHPSGFWPGEKDEQSQAYARRATGDWLWQVDCDEFYRQRDLQDIMSFLTSENPSMVFLYVRMFMYHPQLEVRGVLPEYCQSQPIARIFRWGSGYRYVAHRPPTVVDAQGNDLTRLNPTPASYTSAKGWYIWHYPFLYRQQFAFKAQYYSNLGFRPGSAEWARDAERMRSPKFAVLWHGMSWLEQSREPMPEAVQAVAREECDYQLPNYVQSHLYQCAASLAGCYLRLLVFVRTRVLRRWWFRTPYCRSGGGASRAAEAPSSTDRLRRTLSRRCLVVRLAKFLGLVGYSTY